MAGKVKTWVWIVVGIVVCGILGVITLAAAGLWFVKSHVDIRTTTVAEASSDFQTIRARFANQKPLIELDDHGSFLHANTDRPAGTQRPETVNFIAYDPDGDKIVKMGLPFWMLRLKMRGNRIDLGNSNVDFAKLRITVEDLEHFGPILILDQKGHDGSRVLIWTQ
jgi:hypothetical protein